MTNVNLQFVQEPVRITYEKEEGWRYSTLQDGIRRCRVGKRETERVWGRKYYRAEAGRTEETKEAVAIRSQDGSAVVNR